MIVLPQIVRSKHNKKKGGGGFVPSSKPGKWRAPGDRGKVRRIESQKRMNAAATAAHTHATAAERRNRLASTHSVPNLSPRNIQPSRQSLMFVQSNQEEDEEDLDNDREEAFVVGGSALLCDKGGSSLMPPPPPPLPPRKRSIKAASYPQDASPPRLSRRPSVTYLPFALRPLPLLQSTVEGLGRMSIASMVTQSQKSQSRPAKKMDQTSAGSSYANIWWRDEPSGTAGLLNRGTHFRYLLQLKSNDSPKKFGNKRINRVFPSGFKKKHSSNAYYGRHGR